jgi:hypothetical protein|tara:strand:+ start:2027 stop:2233 length:207 start_codon:yes stop_codon:yes gene_type:complete
MPEKNFIISLTEINTLLAYLQNRPFKEVVSVIGILNSVSKNEYELAVAEQFQDTETTTVVKDSKDTEE